MTSIETPALDHMAAQRKALGTEDIGAFLDWLRDERKVTLCEFLQHTPGTPCPHSGKSRRALWKAGVMSENMNACPECGADLTILPAHEWVGEPTPEGYYPICETIETLLAEYTKVDMKAVENERRAMLNAIRSPVDGIIVASVEARADTEHAGLIPEPGPWIVGSQSGMWVRQWPAQGGQAAIVDFWGWAASIPRGPAITEMARGTELGETGRACADRVIDKYRAKLADRDGWLADRDG